MEAVVFDMDGVIFDSERAFMDCWLVVAGRHGLENLEENYKAATGTTPATTRRIMLDAYGEDFPYDQYVEEAKAIWNERYKDWEMPMKSGVRELLAFLTESGKKIALASSTRREVVLAELGAAGLLPYFEQIVCGDMIECSKPAPDIFLKACELLKVAPENAIAIEDSYNGIRSASAAGMKPIMVPDLLPANAEMKQRSVMACANLDEVRRELEATHFLEG